MSDSGRSDVIVGLRKHGGAVAVARRMGCVINGGFEDEGEVVGAVQAFMEQQVLWCLLIPVIRVHVLYQGLDKVPTRKQLVEAGRRDLCNAVVRRVGGFRRLARLVQEGRDGALLEACWKASSVSSRVLIHDA